MCFARSITATPSPLTQLTQWMQRHHRVPQMLVPGMYLHVEGWLAVGENLDSWGEFGVELILPIAER